jgi:hypothetical protein
LRTEHFHDEFFFKRWIHQMALDLNCCVIYKHM